MENKFLIFVIVLLSVLALIQLVKVYELTNRVTGNKNEEVVSPGENMVMASLFLVFMIAYFGFIIWMMMEYGNGGMGKAGTEHGEMTDTLLTFNWWIILPVFFVVSGLLFSFAFIYRRDPNRKALYFPHNNKLEMIWTVVPAVALAAIIIYGLKTWNFIMNPKEQGTSIELYAKQFDWTARYSGENNQLGKSNFKLITGENPLGVITTESIKGAYAKIDKEIHRIDSVLSVNSFEKYVDNKKVVEYLLPEAKVAELSEKLEKIKRQKYRITAGLEQERNAAADDALAADDYVVKGELHLIKDHTYTFHFRSQDVIHSAWFPHFRAQMNCVPGMTTSFTLKPIFTTQEMRADDFIKTHYQNLSKIHNERKRRIGEEEEKVDFNYLLMCNKICGASHYNMQMTVIVETEEEFKAWAETQTTLSGAPVKYTSTPVIVEEEVAEEAH